MTRRGEPYQELVAEVQRALHPGALIEVGQWVEGPDGERDKDWRRAVGIETVDALESKRRDLGATNALICSNSGFTSGALLKAARVGIGAISVLAMADKRVRCMLTRFFVIESRSIEQLRIRIYPEDPQTTDIPEPFDIARISFEDAPIANWLSIETKQIITKLDASCEFMATYEFDAPRLFDVHDRQVPLLGLAVWGRFKRGWLGQTVRVNLTKGMFDHIRHRITVPPEQGYFLGWIDQEAWVPTEQPPPRPELEPGEFAFEMTALYPFPPIAAAATPPIGSYVCNRHITLTSSEAQDAL